MDVADFLELQGTFQGNGVVQPATQEERVLHLRKVLGPADDLRLQRQHGLQGGRQVAHGFEVACFRLAESSPRLGQRQRQQEQAGQLVCGEGLGRGHADLNPGASPRMLADEEG